MILRILRVVLTSLALFLMVAGSLNLGGVGASELEIDPGTAPCGPSGACGCPGGTTQCCTTSGITCYINLKAD